VKSWLKRSYFLTGLVRAARQLGLDVRRGRWRLARGRQIQSWLKAHPVRKLQIGGGRNRLEGWLNTDYRPRSPEQVYLDATQPFPFADATFHCVFSEHVIEHLAYREGQFMLRECHRILQPGGKIRVATPNLLNIVGLAMPEKNPLQRRYIAMATERYIPENRAGRAAFVINNFFWDFGHYFVYDPECLTAALAEAGFGQITAWQPGESDDPQLAGLEQHGQVIGEELNQFETMVFQAVRPGG
jgi:predicted SAM-dependent methyltransferase